MSTFNRELCKAIRALGHAVYCLVPHCTPAETENAAAHGVTLLAAPPDPGLSDEMRLSSVRDLPDGIQPDVIVGHGRVTGHVAKVLSRRFEKTRRIHFIHVAPGAIEWFKDHSLDATQRAEDREQLETALASTATLVAAVGPLLLREFSILLGGIRQDIHQFNPGIGASELAYTIPIGIQCLVSGRAEDEKLKGLDIAARAFGLLDPEEFQRPILMVRGAPTGSGDDLRRRLIGIAQRPGVDIRIRAFNGSAERVQQDFRQSSVVLMPSRSEGFGLIGLEAISAGIPVLLSDRSGLAELLKELVPDLAPQHVVQVSDDLETDGPAWARRLANLLHAREPAFKRAAELRTRLAPLLSWNGAAVRLLDALERAARLDATRRMSQPPPLPNVVHLPVAERGAITGRDKSNVADLEVIDLAGVRAWGWDDERLQTEIYKLDYETMEGLTDDHSGTPRQWGPVFSDHPESWRLIATRNGRLIGYWHFVVLFSDQYQEARAGVMLDKDITADRARSFELPGVYNAYFAGIAILPEYRKPTVLRMLLHSLLRVLEDLAREQVFIGEFCANAFTPGGVSLCKTLGMKRCARHVNHGEIFEGQLLHFLDLPVAQPFSELRRLYLLDRISAGHQ